MKERKKKKTKVSLYDTFYPLHPYSKFWRRGNLAIPTQVPEVHISKKIETLGTLRKVRCSPFNFCYLLSSFWTGRVFCKGYIQRYR